MDTFREYAHSLLDACIGPKNRESLTDESLRMVHSGMMRQFLVQTKKEIEFILNELILICKYFLVSPDL